MRLCPHHTRDLEWRDCTKRFLGCQINLARLNAKPQGYGKPPRVPVEIPTDIQAMSVSKQRKLQLAWSRLGKCVYDGADKDPNSATYCTYHMVYQRERQRTPKRKRRNFNAASYQSEFRQFEE